MANTYKQPTQSDLEREQFRLGLASAQNKAYTQSQANPSQSASEIDYTTAPDRISLYDLNKLNQSNAQSTSKSPPCWTHGKRSRRQRRMPRTIFSGTCPFSLAISPPA